MSSNYITPEGFKVLKDEFERLWLDERPRLVQQVEEAAAQGDRSENAEYIYGKKRLREIDRRVRFLKKRLNELAVVSAVPADTAKIFFGAWVRLEDEQGGEVCYRIVGPDEFDAARGYISIDSPMGKALMGRRVDDEVVVNRPMGRTSFVILEVAYKPL